MRLIQCHIENFGGLSDLTVEFDPDFHLFCEPNGWGKSTLAAFLRIMFFGFEGENKRKATENERKRFEPWQGGVYGGQITFETDGRTYTAARIFSDKKADDVFELRDTQTNLKSDDFSEKLGEEIFQINGESFARTVFLGQNDCATATTDSINAKIGNLTDNMNDLDCYEKAAGALQDAINSLTPRRKTGAISKLNNEITRMQTEVRQNASLEDAIRDCTQREQEARDELAANRQQQDELFVLAGKVSRTQDRKAKKKEYDRLCTACEQTEDACWRAEDRFPGEVLSEEELQGCMTACQEMDQAAESMRISVLSEKEQRQLKELEEKREKVKKTEEFVKEGEEKKNERKEYEGPQKGRTLNIGRLLTIIGVIVVAIGLVIFYFYPLWLNVILPAAGVFLVGVGRFYRQKAGVRLPSFMEVLSGWQLSRQENREVRAKKESLTGEREELQEMETQLAPLEEKQQHYQDARKQYEEKRSFVEQQINRMGLMPKDPYGTQLQGIWRQTIDLENARKAAQAARQEKKAFEDGSDMNFLLEEKDELPAEDLPSMEELHKEQIRLEKEADEIRTRADAYSSRLADLSEKYDELAVTGEQLDAAEEERGRLKGQYDQARIALDCLSTAKEAMTAKYMEPLMNSFCEYYRIMTGEDALTFRMDANTNLTVEECGMQRETVFLSQGWQDLIGLCMRLSLVDAMYPDEKPFLILDDPLVSLDEEKTAGGKRLLAALAGRYQIIYFTCREDFSETMEPSGQRGADNGQTA